MDESQKRINIEAAVAGAALMNQKLANNVITIESDDFIYPPAKAVICAMKAGLELDPIVIAANAKEFNLRVKVSDITALHEAVVSSKNLSHYVTELKKVVYHQRHEHLKQKFAQQMKNTDDIVELCQICTYEEHQLRMKYIEKDDGKTLLDCCVDLIDRIDKREPNKALVRTGWEMLDNPNGGGFLPNEVIIIAARPSVGKTAAALQLSSSNEPGVLFMLEMDNSQVAPRLLASTAKKNTMIAARNPAKLDEHSWIVRQNCLKEHLRLKCLMTTTKP